MHDLFYDLLIRIRIRIFNLKKAFNKKRLQVCEGGASLAHKVEQAAMHTVNVKALLPTKTTSSSIITTCMCNFIYIRLN